MAIRKYNNGTIRLTGNDANEFFKTMTAPIRVDDFNKKFNVGDTVTVLDDEGNEFTDTIAAPASIRDNYIIETWLAGKGPYYADRVKSKIEQ